MKDFIKIPSSKISLKRRKAVYSVGVNDADYMVKATVNGVRQYCPFYAKWADMIRRCYSPVNLKRNPTYKDCTVCDEWLTFSNFKKWMEVQDWEGMELDKDIKINGNRIYSPESCIFIPHEVNSLLNDSKKTRGDHPQGVSFHKRDNVFAANCSLNGKLVYLGSFKDSESASIAYRKFKHKCILEMASRYSSPISEYIKAAAEQFND